MSSKVKKTAPRKGPIKKEARKLVRRLSNAKAALSKVCDDLRDLESDVSKLLSEAEVNADGLQDIIDSLSEFV